ncbi:hypothetical protein B0I32_14117 [Nonomuraea fuscirosea]|uniref:Uncharacterized protein n=1 Tax=Nonomuraea fuscirosea TaxID=1291556 RepID=A0A2T0LW16_9ACTN|nr:hypothetical protein B0I32_14117 [Nonomuraea fuscirosea]
MLGAGVEGGGGLVANKQVSVAVEAPGHSDALPLAAGQLATVLEAAIQQGAVAVREAGDDLVGSGDGGSGVLP